MKFWKPSQKALEPCLEAGVTLPGATASLLGLRQQHECYCIISAFATIILIGVGDGKESYYCFVLKQSSGCVLVTWTQRGQPKRIGCGVPKSLVKMVGLWEGWPLSLARCSIPFPLLRYPWPSLPSRSPFSIIRRDRKSH